MIESTTKRSRATEQLAAGRDGGVHDHDTALGTLTCLRARNKSIALGSDTSATLCFIRVRARWQSAAVEYHDGKWFEIPGMTAYQIFPDTDTVLLTIQKPARTSAEQGKKHFAVGRKQLR